MKKLLKNCAFVLALSLTYTSVYADDNYCMENDGYIYPIFESKVCDTSDDIILNQKEFSYLFDFEKNKRLAQLTEYRKNPEKFETRKESDLIKKLPKVKNQKNLTDEEKEKIKLEQKRLAKISKEEKIKLKKQENEERKKQRLAEQEKKKRKRLAEIAKREELKKIKKRNQEEKLAKIQKEKEEKKRRRLAQQEEEKKRKLLAKKKQLDRKKLDQTNEETLVVNNNLKAVYFDGQIVKKELFPNVDPTPDVDFVTLDKLDNKIFEDLISQNTNLILIVPKDYDSSSIVVAENQRTSKVVTGYRTVPNPEYKRLQIQMANTDRRMKQAQRAAAYWQAMASNPRNYNSGSYWLDVAAQAADLAKQIKMQNLAASLGGQLNKFINQYSTTPEFLDKEVFSGYNFVVHNIKGEKKAIYQVVQIKNEKFLEKNISIKENKDFKVAFGINPDDKNYNSLTREYTTTQNVAAWQNNKLNSISSNEFVSLINNEPPLRNIENTKDLYESLDLTPKSWFKDLFKTKNKRKKVASLNKNTTSNYKEDSRFDSVVMVKTESGLGSGFFVSKDEILTNYHVIEKSLSIILIDRNNKRSSAVVIKKDLKRDLALLKTNYQGVPVEFFEGELKQGEMVEALGHPKGRKFSLTKGWVSAVREESSIYSATGVGDVLYIQTDAAINKGNSGGPLFYKDKVVGVNTQGLSKDSTEGMNFAVHFSEVKKFLDK